MSRSERPSDARSEAPLLGTAAGFRPPTVRLRLSEVRVASDTVTRKPAGFVLIPYCVLSAIPYDRTVYARRRTPPHRAANAHHCHAALHTSDT